MKILTVDVGGTGVKILASGQTEARRFASGPKMTPARMVAGVKKLAADWEYDVVSIGYPGLVANGRIVAEPHNLAPKWRGFDFEAAFKCPVKIINDAAMQALGSYESGLLLFMGRSGIIDIRILIKGALPIILDITYFLTCRISLPILFLNTLEVCIIRFSRQSGLKDAPAQKVLKSHFDHTHPQTLLKALMKRRTSSRCPRYLALPVFEKVILCLFALDVSWRRVSVFVSTGGFQSSYNTGRILL